MIQNYKKQFNADRSKKNELRTKMIEDGFTVEETVPVLGKYLDNYTLMQDINYMQYNTFYNTLPLLPLLADLLEENQTRTEKPCIFLIDHHTTDYKQHKINFHFFGLFHNLTICCIVCRKYCIAYS